MPALLSVNDVDSGGNLSGATVSIGTGFVNGDTLSVGTAGGLTVAYDSTTGTLSLSGSASLTHLPDRARFHHLQLHGWRRSDRWRHQHQPHHQLAGDRRLGHPRHQRGRDQHARRTVHVAPTVTPSGAIATFTGGGSPVLLDGALSVNDVDSGGSLTSATVSIGGFVNGDTLSVGTAGGLTVAYDSTTGTLSLSGPASLTTYQAALLSIPPLQLPPQPTAIRPPAVRTRPTPSAGW